MSNIPALPIPPEQYDKQYFIQLTRILTQYFRGDSSEDDTQGDKAEVQQVLTWLS